MENSCPGDQIVETSVDTGDSRRQNNFNFNIEDPSESVDGDRVSQEYSERAGTTEEALGDEFQEPLSMPELSDVGDSDMVQSEVKITYPCPVCGKSFVKNFYAQKHCKDKEAWTS